MEDLENKRLNQIFAYARYLSWADLQRRVFEEEMSKEVPPSDLNAARDHEWCWFGLMCYWYSSLYVVIEAWEKLGFTDPIVDRLLSGPSQFPSLLRRYRNAIFHYQSSLDDPRFVELLEHGAEHVYWIRSLHYELVRSFAEHLDGLMIEGEGRTELRGAVERLVHWYPYKEAPEIASLEGTLREGRDTLAKHPSDQTQARRELESALEGAESILREGRQKWAKMRAKMLGEAGVGGELEVGTPPNPGPPADR
jgi:hypothetical protein